MKYDGIINTIVERAKKDIKTIVLPESSDLRVLSATSKIVEDNIANIILIGNEQEVLNLSKKNDIKLDLNKIKIIDPPKSDKFESYAQALYELRKNKGMTLEQANETLKDYVYFATMMVKLNDADGLVSGAVNTTAHTLRPALQIIKARENVKNVSSCFIIDTPNKSYGLDGKFVFSDTSLIEFPTEEQLVDIVKTSAESFRNFLGAEPVVALLSYSTRGSAKNEAVQKIANVANTLKSMNLDFEVDGELQLDAAIVPEVAKIKAPDSVVAGRANVLIFPDIQSGNIGYKLVQRFSNGIALGPVTQGLAKPVNDLSRGCSVEEIIGTVAITSIQASQN